MHYWLRIGQFVEFSSVTSLCTCFTVQTGMSVFWASSLRRHPFEQFHTFRRQFIFVLWHWQRVRRLSFQCFDTTVHAASPRCGQHFRVFQTGSAAVAPWHPRSNRTVSALLHFFVTIPTLIEKTFLVRVESPISIVWNRPTAVFVLRRRPGFNKSRFSISGIRTAVKLHGCVVVACRTPPPPEVVSNVVERRVVISTGSGKPLVAQLVVIECWDVIVDGSIVIVGSWTRPSDSSVASVVVDKVIHVVVERWWRLVAAGGVTVAVIVVVEVVVIVVVVVVVRSSSGSRCSCSSE